MGARRPPGVSCTRAFEVCGPRRAGAVNCGLLQYAAGSIRFRKRDGEQGGKLGSQECGQVGICAGQPDAGQLGRGVDDLRQPADPRRQTARGLAGEGQSGRHRPCKQRLAHRPPNRQRRPKHRALTRQPRPRHRTPTRRIPRPGLNTFQVRAGAMNIHTVNVGTAMGGGIASARGLGHRLAH